MALELDREQMIKKLRSDRCSKCKIISKGFWICSHFICIDCLDEMMQDKPRKKKGKKPVDNPIKNLK